MSRDLIERVRSGITERNKVIQEVYANPSHCKAVIGTLVKKGCTELKAKDYYTDAVVAFIKACYRPDFEIQSSLTNYLIGAAKNIWLKEVTKLSRMGTTEDLSLTDAEESIEVTIIREEERRLLQKVLNQLDETCRKVLLLWSMNKRMKAVAEKMNYKSEGMARKKKHQCLRRLYSIVDKHPAIKEELRTMI